MKQQEYNIEANQYFNNADAELFLAVRTLMINQVAPKIRKIQLTTNQQMLFENFLTWSCKEEPKELFDWGWQYVLLLKMKNNLTDYIQNDMLKCSRLESLAIHNYFQFYIDNIFENRLGEDLFNKNRNLFVIVNNNLCKCRYPYFIFIPSTYNYERKKVVVNPLQSAEQIIKEHYETTGI